MKTKQYAWLKRAACRIVFAACGLLGGVSGCWAQQAELSGIVQDPSGAGVERATIVLTNRDTREERKTTTNSTGAYSLAAMPPGNYDLTVAAQGFQTQSIEGIRLDTAAKLSRQITLSLGSTSQTVTVSGSGININTVDASVSTVVDRQFVENMPLNGRSFQSLLTLVPG